MFFQRNRANHQHRRRIERQLDQSLQQFYLKEDTQEQSIFSHLNENTHPVNILLTTHCFEHCAILLVKNETNNLEEIFNCFSFYMGQNLPFCTTFGNISLTDLIVPVSKSVMIDSC